MPTAAELLAKTSNSDKTLVIDNDLRTIKIPSSVTNLGVESDDEVLRLDFRMPRYLGETDLSTFAIRINYLNAKGEGDVYSVSDMQIVGDNLTFSWLVGPNATAYKGDTKFNVCMKIVDSEGYIQKEYNTTVATLPVLEGLETEEGLIEFYSDILEQWKNQLFGIGDTEEAKLGEVSEEERQKIVDKGIEVLATIPEDYTSTYEMANNAYRTRANAIVSTKQGEVVTLDDSSADPLRGLRIFGKTTQITTTGKNLIPKATPKTEYGITMSVADDGTITLNGTATGNAFSRVINCDVPAGSYTFSANNPIAMGTDSTNSPYLAIRDASLGWWLNAIFTTANFTKAVSFGTDQTTVLIAVPEGVTVDNFTLKLQLEEGSVVTEYEPYSGGVESPCPDWQQELKHIESPSVVIHGGNLAYFGDILAIPKTSNGVTFTLKDGRIILTGTPTIAEGDINTVHARAISDSELIVGAIYECDNCSMQVEYADGSMIWTKSIVATADMVSINAYIQPKVGSYTQGLTFKPEMWVNGCRPTEFVAAVPTQSIDLPHTLAGIPVTENGNYTDSNGQQWICDEIDFERGVHIQRVKTVTLNGTESWNHYASGDGVNQFYSMFNDCYTNNATVNAMATGLKGTSVSNRSYNYNTVYTASQSSYNYICVNIQGYATQSEFATFLSENPITVLYRLTTPIETELTAEELVAFWHLHTNYPNTTVLNNSGACMEVKYNEDLKFYANEIMVDAAETVITQNKIQAAVDNWLSAHYSTAEGVSF